MLPAWGLNKTQMKRKWSSSKINKTNTTDSPSQASSSKQMTRNRLFYVCYFTLIKVGAIHPPPAPFFKKSSQNNVFVCIS